MHRIQYNENGDEQHKLFICKIRLGQMIHSHIFAFRNREFLWLKHMLFCFQRKSLQLISSVNLQNFFWKESIKLTISIFCLMQNNFKNVYLLSISLLSFILYIFFISRALERLTNYK